MRKTGLVKFMMLLTTASAVGCTTGPTLFERHDKFSQHEPGSDAWWAEKAMLPPGVRQRNKKGKMWPVNPRSMEEPQQFTHTFHAQHYWPLPYQCQDRESVRCTMEQLTSLGWQEETTLYDRHFHPETQLLSRAGELQLNYLMYAIPPERRSIHVQSTHNSAKDTARIETVNAGIAARSEGRVSIPVQLRDCLEYGRPAAEVQTINTLYNSSIPSPRLGGSAGGGGESSESSSGN